jgi:hypothetical protein
MAVPAVWAQGPALTTISDTVYRADGTVAAGTALISWPAFQTAEGNAVAAGTKTATIGAAGAFSTQLVPNVGAAPTGTYYTVGSCTADPSQQICQTINRGVSGENALVTKELSNGRSNSD